MTGSSYYYNAPQLYKMPKRFSQGKTVLGGCSCAVGDDQPPIKKYSPYIATAIAAVVVWNIING